MFSGPDMRSVKESFPLLLMVFSIGLLIVVQFLWLKSAWKEAREDFQEETNHLFRQTIFSMHDSLVMRNIEPIRGDSVYRVRRFFLGDSLKTLLRPDTATHTGVRGSGIAEVFISSENEDSVRQLLRPLAGRMRAEKGLRKFIVRMGPDSLDKDSIAHQFRLSLLKSHISVPFEIHHISSEKPGIPFAIGHPDEVLGSEVVPLNPLNRYAVSFTSTTTYFLKAIAPQVLFSVFVTLLTIGSFYLMNRSMRSQRKLMKIKNDFISNMSHELKTPVSTVSVALEALEKFKALDDPGKTNEYLRIAQNELGRLTLLTDKILQTVSFENRDPEMKVEKMDLDAEIREVLASMKLVFERRKIQVRYERSGSDFTLNGSRQHLVTVIYNLLDNAIKYSPESSSIVVHLQENGNEITLSVRDHGIGIPAMYHKKVFEKFFRVPSGDVHNTKGYGLGLSYVARIIENHKGVIKLESEVGKGSSFNIRLSKNAFP